MSLAPGQRLGPYEVVGILGAGGMGEVYRARDAALNRDVAIKILPDPLANNSEQLTRFTREARTLAALNHPNIAYIHGLEHSSSVRALVMELVEGEDLSQVMARGPMPPAVAVPIARQIAEALEAAHEQGIVHRDLKPANVKVRPDGTVKVLDFGLAKGLGPDGVVAAIGAESPTLTSAGTDRGVILGTAAYMAPEQARGRAVDKRADIWAFGVVLYEMLSGARAFGGQSFSDILAAVLREEIDWSKLPGATPPRLRQLLERCLAGDAKQRLRDIGEARIALASIERGGPEPTANTSNDRRPWRERVAWTAAALALMTAAVLLVQRLGSADETSSSSHVSRLSILPPPGMSLNPDSTNVAISPDGRMVAIVVGRGISIENQLWVRSIDSTVARRIEGGDGVSLPFWSPDSTRIGFFADRKLKTVAVAGGPAEIVCEAPFGRGGTWNRANVIVFARDASGPLYRVSANGGTATPVTALDAARDETGHRFPSFLPDGDRFLFAAMPGSNGAFEIFAGSLKDPAIRTLVGSLENAPVYAEPGWLLFARNGVLAAQPFDVNALRLTGEAVSLGDQPGVARAGVAYDAGPRVSASTVGSLAYFQPPPVDTTLQWLDVQGKASATLNVPAGRYGGVAIAPDGTKAVLVRHESPTSSNLWLIDLTRGSAGPLTSGSGRSKSPVWSPDSKRILFAIEDGGRSTLFDKTLSDASSGRKVIEFSDPSAEPHGWSRDGASILFSKVVPGTKWDVYRIPASGSGAQEPVVNGPGVEVGGKESPAGGWIGYFSDETGRLEVFVKSLAPSGPKLQVSTGGVQHGWWTADGKHLLFLKGDDTLWRVAVDLNAAAPGIGPPEQLATFPSVVAMDLAPTGDRFLALVPERQGIGAVTVVQSWRSALGTTR